jgi:ATP synthase protein I
MANGEGANDRDGAGQPVSGQSAEDRALKARLEKLSSTLEAQRQQEAREVRERQAGPGGETGRAMSLGLRVLSEFVAGIIAGSALGWLLDKWFSTSPLFLLLLGALGTAAGFLNVYRIATQPTSPAPVDNAETVVRKRDGKD